MSDYQIGLIEDGFYNQPEVDFQLDEERANRIYIDEFGEEIECGV